MESAAHRPVWPRRVFLSFLSAASFLATTALTSTAADAGEAVAALIDARVRYDNTRWQATARPDRISFTPVDADKLHMDPLDLRVHADTATCSDLARLAFETGLYDTRSLAATPVSIGGKSGERFSAHTGCRSATPRGVIICAKHGGQTYLLQALNPGCSGRNLFSGIDPLEEIANGISFATADTR